MEPFKRQKSAGKFRLTLLVVVAALLFLIAFTAGCSSETGPDSTVVAEVEDVGGESTVAPPVDALRCADCELVEVFEVVDANTVRTSIGDIQMYGAYVVDQPADCAAQARERLTSLSGSAIRIEPGPSDTVRNNSDHYYLFTADGQSIEEQLVREGLAQVWKLDGQHLGWFVFRNADARENDAGCLWQGFQAFQRGEPSDFRIPGLTYPEDR